MTLTNQELNEAIRTAQKYSSAAVSQQSADVSEHLNALRAEQLRRATAPLGEFESECLAACEKECAALKAELNEGKQDYRDFLRQRQALIDGADAVLKAFRITESFDEMQEESISRLRTAMEPFS